MNKSAETLRQRADRIYTYEVSDHPKLLAGQMGHPLTFTDLSEDERLEISLIAINAVKVALLDLAEQLDARLGGDVQPEQ